MSYISWWSPGWVARPFLLSLLNFGRASRPRPTRNKQTSKQTNKQTRRSSRTPYPIAPRDQNTPLGTLALMKQNVVSVRKNEKIEKSDFDPKMDSKSYVFKQTFTKRLILGDPSSIIPRCAMFG